MFRRGRTAPPPLNEETMEPIPENPDVPLDDDPELPDPPGPAITERESLNLCVTYSSID